jgi:hypothetical protein
MMTDNCDDDTLKIVGTIGGDLTTFVINQIQNLECGFRYLHERDQREVIRCAREKVQEAIQRAVLLIASQGRDSIPVTIKKVVNTGTEIQAIAIASRSDQLRQALFDSAGFSAILVIADSSKFMGGSVPEATPDQATFFGEQE